MSVTSSINSGSLPFTESLVRAAPQAPGVFALWQGGGIVYLFEDLLRPHFESGALKPVLERWWLRGWP